jgi:tetratricopeptide (TPR) repeat protein
MRQAPTLENIGVCPKKSLKLPTKAPTPAGYAKVAASLVATYRKQLGASAKKLDVEIAKATTPKATTALVGAVLTTGSGSGSIYVAARAAVSHPKDPLVASNLGALLVADRKYADAQSVLLHADALAPDQTLVTTNRAWVLYGAKDSGAKAMFERVIAKQADHASAQLGLGLLAACADEPEKAANHIRKSADSRPSAMAMYALEATSPDAPGVYTGSNPLVLPQLPISASWDLAAKDLRDSTALQKQLMAIYLKWTAQIVQNKDKIVSLWKDGRHGGLINHRYAAIREPYSKLAGAKTKESLKALTPMVQDLMHWSMSSYQRILPARQACGGDSRCEKKAEYDDCLLSKKKAIDGHAKFAPLAQRAWADTEPLIAELWLRSTGQLERFHDPEWAAIHRVALEAEVTWLYHMFVAGVVGWTTYTNMIHRQVCVPPPPPPSGAEPNAKLPGFKIDECPLPSFQFEVPGVKWLEFEIECLKVKVQARVMPAGAMGYLQYDGLKGVTTVFAGFGAGEVEGGFGLEGRAGVYVDFTGTKVSSLGIEAEATAMMKGTGYEEKIRFDALALEAGAPADAKFFDRELSGTMEGN